MGVRAIRRLIALEQRAEELLGQAYATGALSARGRHRVVRVARTVADLDGAERVSSEHLLTALALRQRAGAMPDEPGGGRSFDAGGELAA
jgi:magnesium chelatase family protein